MILPLIIAELFVIDDAAKVETVGAVEEDVVKFSANHKHNFVNHYTRILLYNYKR